MTQEIGPDPRFGMQAPVIDADDDHHARRRALDARGAAARPTSPTPGNALSLRSLTETTTANGRTRPRATTPRTRRFTDSSPDRAHADDRDRRRGRPLRGRRAGRRADDVHLRRPRSAHRHGRRARAPRPTPTTPRGRVRRSPTRSRARPSSRYDLADRPRRRRGPDGRVVAYSLRRARQPAHGDAAGRAAHTFAYTRARAARRATRRRAGAGRATTLRAPTATT